MNAAKNQCPCGCDTPLPVISGKRRIVCVGFWRTLPAEIRSDITSPASDIATRRAAIRRALELAHKKASQRVAEQQLRFQL